MIAVLPAPVLPRSHTTGAMVWARVRASCASLPAPRVSPNRASLIALQNRSRSPTMRASSAIRAAYAMMPPVLILFEEPTTVLGTDPYKYCVFSGGLFPERLARINYVCIVAGWDRGRSDKNRNPDQRVMP